MRKSRSHLWQFLLLSLLLSLNPALADVSLNQAVKQAKKRTGGQVISAETRNQDGHRVHNIRILTEDGKVRRLRINADSRGGGNGGRR
ncbi:MAG: PepSY domain-containing protein [Candidatus Thiodiazotropha sp.]